MENKCYKGIALFLSVTLGILGVDRFYLGYTKMGLLKRLTLGCCGVLYVIDIIKIASGELQPADGNGYAQGVKLHIGHKLRDSIREKNAFYRLRKGQITQEEYDKIIKSLNQ